MSVRVRYAPSPTGNQHIGGVRTALINYLFAKSVGGTFILRLEDTDRSRYSDAYVKNLYDKIVKDYDSILQISHLKQIADWHSSFIVIKKENNISHIEFK